jgi:hypothetical protein
MGKPHGPSRGRDRSSLSVFPGLKRLLKTSITDLGRGPQWLNAERAGWRLARAADRRSVGPRRSRRGSPAPQAGGQTRSSGGRMSPFRTTRPRGNYHLVTRSRVCARERTRLASLSVARGLYSLWGDWEEARGEGGPAGGLSGGAGRPGFRMGGGGGVAGRVPRGVGESLSIVAE